MLWRYIPNPSYFLPSKLVELKEDFSYSKEPLQILSKKMKQLRSQVIPLVKVLWQNYSTEEAIWERKDEMKSKYPHLFQTEGNRILE